MTGAGPVERADARLPGARPAALIAVAAVLGFWLAHLNVPFARVPGFADWIGNRNGLIAQNYVRYGLAATGGAQIMNLEPVESEADRVIYHGHPAGLDLLTAGVFVLTGSQAPWAHRLLPLLAIGAAFVLLHRLLVRAGHDPWPALLVLALLPVVAIHGVNLSYEPLCLPVMLGAILLWLRGWRWRLLPYVILGGLIDYPVLYLCPVFAVSALAESRRAGRPLAPAIGYGAALAAAGVGSIGIHVLHVVLAMGDLQGNQGMPWDEKIRMVIFDARVMPPLGVFLETVGRGLLHSFTVPGLLVALLGIGLVRGRVGLPAGAFAFCGMLHVLVFRGHAVKHDFWLWYLAPFVAIAAALALVRLPALLSWSAVVATGAVGFLGLPGPHGVLGGPGTLEVWRERREPPVRAVAADLKRLFADEVVLHQLRAPSGWAMEPFRGAPVFEGIDFLTQTFQPGVRSFRNYLDGLAIWGYAARPQRAFLFLPNARPNDRRDIEQFLPASEVARLDGEAGSYVVYDLGRYLFDPADSPHLRGLLGDEECRRLWYRARLHLAVPAFPPSSLLVWLDGASGHTERLRGRTVRSGGREDVARWTPDQEWTLVAWPRTPFARALEGHAPGSLRRALVRWRAQEWQLPYLPGRAP